MGRIFEIDHLTGSVERFHFDESGSSKHKNVFTIEDQQNVDGILDLNHAIRTAGVSQRKKPMKLTARIPLNVYFELVQKGITRDKKAFNEWLDAPENAMWRVDGRKKIGNHRVGKGQ